MHRSLSQFIGRTISSPNQSLVYKGHSLSNLDQKYFPNFETCVIDTGEVQIHCVRGGQGPPLLLLHGYPQTHLIWHDVAPQLAEHFTVVATDLRGYGKSDKPFGTDDHATYSKRVMAQDQIDVMCQLGHKSFFVAGHDRGGRVALRMALDHPEKILKLAVLDIAPTADMYGETTQAFATAYYHWFFLIQPYDLPERLIGSEADFYVRKKLKPLTSNCDIPEDIFNHYLESFCPPEAIHASCEDYRASASIDLEHDAKDADIKVSCPILAIWGERGIIGKLFDPIMLWSNKTNELITKTFPCGHYIPEEEPEKTLEAFLEFFA